MTIANRKKIAIRADFFVFGLLAMASGRCRGRGTQVRRRKRVRVRVKFGVAE